MRKALSGRLYYGWVVVGVIFLALLVSAGVRAAPAVLINPLDDELGWGRAAISFAVSVGLLIYGLSGPAAGWLMDRLGPKKVTLAGLALRIRPLYLALSGATPSDLCCAGPPAPESPVQT